MRMSASRAHVIHELVLLAARLTGDARKIVLVLLVEVSIP
jgi:hypothetical protein